MEIVVGNDDSKYWPETERQYNNHLQINTKNAITTSKSTVEIKNKTKKKKKTQQKIEGYI